MVGHGTGIYHIYVRRACKVYNPVSFLYKKLLQRLGFVLVHLAPQRMKCYRFHPKPPKSPNLYIRIAAAAMPAVSVLKILGPIFTTVMPLCTALFTSSSSNPPSGPTIIAMLPYSPA